MESRRAARILAVDPNGNVLLFQFARPAGEVYWATPGGGLEEGENFEAAAERESAEELGLDRVPLAPLWNTSSDFVLGGRPVHQEERFFLLRVQEIDFTPQVRAAHQLDGILQARWWSVADLEDTDELIYPVALLELLKKIIKGSSPP